MTNDNENYEIDETIMFDSMLLAIPLGVFTEYVNTTSLDKQFYRDCLKSFDTMRCDLMSKIERISQNGLYIDKLLCDYFIKVIQNADTLFSQKPIEFNTENKSILKLLFLANCTIFINNGMEVLKNTASVNFTNENVEEFKRIHIKICDELRGLLLRKSPEYVNTFISEVGKRCLEYFKKHGRRTDKT